MALRKAIAEKMRSGQKLTPDESAECWTAVQEAQEKARLRGRPSGLTDEEWYGNKFASGASGMIWIEEEE